MNRVLQYDQVKIDVSDASKISQHIDDDFGPVTVFHDVVIAREIVHEYDDGWAYKPAKELEDGFWTAKGAWASAGGHPDTPMISNRDQIHGRTVNPRFTKSLKDPKTKRPNNRGVLADLEVFDNRVSPDLLQDMKSGNKEEVSIGFFFDKDDSSGVIDEKGHPLNGTKYDYVQRRYLINHTAFGLEAGMGRCPMPFCGVGADGRKIGGDPFAGYKDFEACIKAIMKENPTYTRKQAAGTCAVIEKRSKAKRDKDKALGEFEETDPLADCIKEMKNRYTAYTDEQAEVMCGIIQEQSQPLREELGVHKDTIQQLKAILDQLLSPKGGEVPMEERRHGNLGLMTESERAWRYFNIGAEKWAALSEEEKQDYINRLPPIEDEEQDSMTEKQWWEMLDWNEMKDTYEMLPDELKQPIIDAGLCPDCSEEDETIEEEVVEDETVEEVDSKIIEDEKLDADTVLKRAKEILEDPERPE